MKKIAVVILNWNGRQLLEQFLPSVISHSAHAQIYIADNASTDTSLAYVISTFPEIKIIKNKGNFGFAKGYNKALKNVAEPYLALVNSDIEVTQNWLQPILDIFENQKDIAIIQPKILDFNRKTHFEYAGAAGGFIDQLGYPFCRGRIFNAIEKDNKQFDDEIPIFWASGACFFIRNQVFKALNGFDASFFAHQEEIDLCWRAFNQNFKTVYTSKSVVYHVGGATLNEENPKKTFLNFRNSLFMLTKNVPFKTLFQILFLRLCLDGIAGIQFLFQGKLNHCFAIIKAHLAFYAHFNHYYKKRNSTQKNNYFKIKSIVFAYFLNNGKMFDEIV